MDKNELTRLKIAEKIKGYEEYVANKEARDFQHTKKLSAKSKQKIIAAANADGVSIPDEDEYSKMIDDLTPWMLLYIEAVDAAERSREGFFSFIEERLAEKN